jgi:alpha-2-macroglobulin-like protein
MSTPAPSRPALVTTLVAVAVLTWSHVRADKSARPALGGPNRYLTALSTDKPIYRPGETVWVRGVVLHAFDHTPLRETANPSVEIKGPKGERVASGSSLAQDGVWAFAWRIPDQQSGGQYTIRTTYPWNGHAPAERKFDVRVFRAPRLKSQIVFLRDGYGPGDKVTATLEVARAEGGVPAGAKITAIARVDGTEVARVPGAVDQKGLCTVSFVLPKPIARGEGSLAFAVEDGGVVETAAKTIPILLQTLDLSLHPEGGHLIAGVRTRVYFEARTPAQKPADIGGVVVDDRGQVITRFRSEHEGRGRFDITARAGARYRLRVQQPSGIKTSFALPAPIETGVTLRARQEVTPAGAKIRLLVASARPQKVRVTLSQRELELSSAVLDLAGGEPQALSLAAKGAGGVLVATVWAATGKPLAERLVFRKPSQKLDIDVRTDKSQYVPGETVTLTARATRNGKPVAAVIGLTVTDEAVLELIEKREQAPQLPAMVLLEPEVRELGDTHVYLDDRNPKAPLALDLLLGTQGWRRFALVNVAKLIQTHGDDARRALALRAEPRAVVGGIVGGVVGGVRARGPAELAAKPKEDQRALPRRALAAPQAPRPAPPAMAPAPRAAAAEPAAPQMPELAIPAQPAAEAEPLAVALAQDEEAKARREVGPGPARGRALLRDQRGLAYVREYAHQLRPNRQPTDRLDFTETLYWHAGARTNVQTGEVTVRFALNDSVTAFRVSAGGFDGGGALGTATATITSVQPFYVEPKLPLEVTAGDAIRIPVSLINGTTENLRAARVQATASGALKVTGSPALDLAPQQRARRILDIAVGHATAPVELTVKAMAGPFADSVTRTMTVKPNGFPFQVSFGGLTMRNGAVAHTVTIPEGVVPASVKANVVVYPTPLANMTQALARLIRDPSGCFEQTSSTSYPLTMAQQYFLSHTGVDAKLVASAQEKLDAGYKRLVGFETPNKGYEWFGESPGHEALTAYGLLHFHDMGKVREVDETMMARTRDWLLLQRDGSGGFARKRRALHTWIEDQDSSNGYILWALLETGAKGLGKEIASFKTAAAKSQNSYVLALGANVLALAGEGLEARRLMDRLAAKQGRGGAVEGATTSIVGSGGEALTIETTSLAVLAWLREPKFAATVEKSMKYLAESSQDGRYGSTQSTVLALRAIVAYDLARARPKAPGSLRIFVDGQAVGGPVTFDASTQGALELPAISPRLVQGAHKLELRMDGGAPMPYSIAVDYHALTPDSSNESKVGLEVSLAKGELREGELVEATAAITNLTSQPVPTPIAIVGLPGGLEPRHDQLKELVKKGTIDAYEVIGREVVLYWRGLPAGKTISVPLSLLAAVPGRYTGPASRAYLYYTDEHKTWVKGLQATIAPKG